VEKALEPVFRMHFHGGKRNNLILRSQRAEPAPVCASAQAQARAGPARGAAQWRLEPPGCSRTVAPGAVQFTSTRLACETAMTLPTPSHVDPHAIDTLERLQTLLGSGPGEASIAKEVDFVHPDYRRMIEASPFAVLATAGPGGLDASPRGDPAGFVQVLDDDKTLLLPERRGNQRADIVTDPRVALLFLIPGVGETLRVNGRARISVAPELLARFVVNGQPPKCVLVITAESVYFQCARALQRSRLWDTVPPGTPRPVPTAGALLESITQGGVDGATYDRELPARQQATLY
jgi:PPOX class probable FMN-dependent enzyme